MKNILILLLVIPAMVSGQFAFAEQYMDSQGKHNRLILPKLGAYCQPADKFCHKKGHAISTLAYVSSAIGVAVASPLAFWAFAGSMSLPTGSFYPGVQGFANGVFGAAASLGLLLYGGSVGMKVGLDADEWIWGDN